GGGVRGGCEPLRGRDLAGAARDAERALEHLLRMPHVAAVAERGPGRCRVRLADGVHATVEAVAEAEHAATLVRLTGSPAHYEKLRGRAPALGHQPPPPALPPAAS